MSELTTLRIHRLAEEISDEIWEIVSSWNYFQKDTIGKQMTRSADSIGANIAEGNGRFSYKENKRFCCYSRGSLMETIVWLGKCKRRHIIDEIKTDTLIEKLYNLKEQLNGYIKDIKKLDDQKKS